MRSNWSRWLVRGALVAVTLALLLYGRYTEGGRSGDFVVWTLVGLGAVLAVFLVWQSRWRNDSP